jgi:hypothetical protein
MGGVRPRRALALGFLVELFAIANLAFLAVDIFLAHTVNRFRAWPEWIPVGFSGAAAPALAVGLWWANRRGGDWRPARGGAAVGVLAILVGIAGLLFHLESQFFQSMSLKSLVYTAPLAAPLAFTGLGLVLLLNRMVPAESLEWDRWVVVLAGGGFMGNFALALLDHAQNGFFYVSEWLPVAASAYAVVFLGMVVLHPEDRRLLRVTLVVLAAQIAIGVLGFAFHLIGDLTGPSGGLRDKFLYGAPVFAPLLFPNLALLAGIGVWDLWRTVPAEQSAPPEHPRIVRPVE